MKVKLYCSPSLFQMGHDCGFLEVSHSPYYPDCPDFPKISLYFPFSEIEESSLQLLPKYQDKFHQLIYHLIL